MSAKSNVSAVVENGADLLINLIINEGVEIVFGYPGGAVLPLYDALYKNPIKHILARHEQGAIHAAEGYARISGKPGVVIATSGPGATNLITGITDAMIDSLPLVVFTGQVAGTVIGTDAFQEADIIGITTPITKHSYQVRDASDLPRIVKEAFHLATTGRPGPVLIDIPKDIHGQLASTGEEVKLDIPGYKSTRSASVEEIQALLGRIAQATQPVILAGAGVLHGKASQELLAFSEKYHLPVASTLLGLGSFPADHSLFLGMAGMHGTFASNMAITESDLLINIGARFDDRVTGNVAHFAPNAEVVHIDIDPAEINKIIPTSLGIVSDSKTALQMLLDAPTVSNDVVSWLDTCQQRKEEFPLWYKTDDKELTAQQAIDRIHQATGGNAIVTTDVGQHQMWAAQFYSFNHPNRWVTSGGLGTMGFGFPAAIGAQLAEPDSLVVSIAGDGGFQMTLQELAVVKELNLPIKIVILNNRTLGMVRQWQELFYEERYSHSMMEVQPDFVKLSESYGIRGVKVETESQLTEMLATDMQSKEPVLIEICVKQQENVFPMVAPGKGIHEMVGVKP